MLTSLYNSIYGSSAQIQSRADSHVAHLEKHYFNKIFKNINAYIHELDVAALNSLRAFLERHKVDKNHEAIKNIDETISKVKSSAEPILNSQNSTGSLHKIINKSVHPPLPKAEKPALIKQDDTTYCDNGSLPLEDFKKFLEEKGGKLTRLVVTRDGNDFDDTYFSLIADKCPQLQEFCLGNGGNYVWKKLTDKGLEPIGLLKNLTVLEFNFYDTMTNLTSAPLEKILGQPHLQKNLQKFQFPERLASDTCLAALQNYQSLKRLKMPCYYCTEKAIASFFNSASISKSLENLELKTQITDSILTALGKCNALKTLMIYSIDSKECKTQTVTLGQCLSQKLQLEELVLKNITVDDKVAAPLANLKELRKIDFDDTFNLTWEGMENLCKDKVHLKELHLRKVMSYISEKCGLFTLKSLTSLRLDFTQKPDGWWNEYGQLTDKALQKLANVYGDQLEELSLNGINPVWGPCSTYFNPIGSFKALKKLIVCNCPEFNDQSLKTITANTLSGSLEHLELIGVPISDASISSFANLQKLSKLLIVNCFGLTEEGRKALVHCETLKNQLVALGLGNFEITKEMAIEIVKEYKFLERLSLTNSEPMPPYENELEKLAEERTPKVIIGFEEGKFFAQDIHLNFIDPFYSN